MDSQVNFIWLLSSFFCNFLSIELFKLFFKAVNGETAQNVCYWSFHSFLSQKSIGAQKFTCFYKTKAKVKPIKKKNAS